MQRALDAVAKFDKSVSRTEIDRLQLIANKSELEIEQAAIDFTIAEQTRELRERDLELAQLSVERRRITAPLTGMVVQWRRHPGEWVEPGIPVVRMIRLNKLRAEGFVSAAVLSHQSVGARVTFVVESEDGRRSEHPGELAFVSPEIDPINGQVRFWAEIDNSRLTLRPGTSGLLIVDPQVAGRKAAALPSTNAEANAPAQ